MKVALAYSGGLDTSVLVHWFAKEKNAEVVTYCADIGQGEELEGLEEKALATGAIAHHTLDLVEEFAADFVYP
ncbi:MAG: argininosuccinate synthase domain-containing protein, partial [Opitutales bacterium]